MSIRELASLTLRTKGCTPPKLLGASTTVVGDVVYLLGGRASSEQLFHMYIFNLSTNTWIKIPPPEGPAPSPRYFHSTDLWNGYLVVFGGIVIDNRTESPYVLDDIWFFSILESRWILSDASTTSQPLSRYGHLSSISADQLFIIGGQDKSDNWIDNMHLYDLKCRSWTHSYPISYHCGTYRGLAAFSNFHVIDPSKDGYTFPIRFKTDAATAIPPTSTDNLVELTCSMPTTEENPTEIFMYLNYDFTNLCRELRLYKATSDLEHPFTSQDLTSDMQAKLASRPSVPPALRFPTGGIIGSYLVLSGIDFTTRHTMGTWTLDLQTLTWTKIEMPSSLSKGSWARSIVWLSSNKLIIFGSRDADFEDDYQSRLLSWDDIVCIDLEAYGVYQPPLQVMTNTARTIGLAALEDGAFADFQVECDDGRCIPCSRELLERRWSWFHEERKKWNSKASNTVETKDKAIPPIYTLSPTSLLVRPDPRLTPRRLYLSEPYPVVLAFLQFLYTQSLMTPLQHAPAVLSSLMLIAATYDVPRLMDLVGHAMHNALSRSREFASGIFDVASLVERPGLRVRAFWIGRRPYRGSSTGKAVRCNSGVNSNTNDPQQKSPLILASPGHDGRSKLKGENLPRAQPPNCFPRARPRNAVPRSVPVSVAESPTDLIHTNLPVATIVNDDDHGTLIAGNKRNERKKPRNSVRTKTTASISAFINAVIDFGGDNNLTLSFDSLEFRNDRIDDQNPNDGKTMEMMQNDPSHRMVTHDSPGNLSPNHCNSSEDFPAFRLETNPRLTEQQLLELRHTINQALGDVASGPAWKVRDAQAVEANRSLVKNEMGCSTTTATCIKLLVDPRFTSPLTTKVHQSRLPHSDAGANCTPSGRAHESAAEDNRGPVKGTGKGKEKETEVTSPSSIAGHVYPASAVVSTGPSSLPLFDRKHRERSTTDPQPYIANIHSHSAAAHHSSRHAGSLTSLNRVMNVTTASKLGLNTDTKASSEGPQGSISRLLPLTISLGETSNGPPSQNGTQNGTQKVNHHSSPHAPASVSSLAKYPTPPQTESERSSPSNSPSLHSNGKIRPLSVLQKNSPVETSTSLASSLSMNTPLAVASASAATIVHTPKSFTPVEALPNWSPARPRPLPPTPGEPRVMSHFR